MCEEKIRDGGILYLMLCNGKWLKVVQNQHVHHFFLFVLTFRKVGKIVPS
jgi:hypothetical protein